MSKIEHIVLNGVTYDIGSTGSGVTESLKAAFLQLAEKVAYIDEHGQTYYDALYNALYPPADLVSVSAVYTQSGTVYDTDSLDTLRSDLVVTAHMSDSTTRTVTGYTLSGTLAEGTSTVTVSYAGLTDTFEVVVTDHNIVDYTRDALAGVTWYDNYTYNNSGILTQTSGEHCTDRFTTQDALYQYIFSNSSDSYTAIFVWDENGTYCGRKQLDTKTSHVYQLKPTYTYALKSYNPTDFDSSNVSMMPVDNRSTAVSEFTISLAAYAESVNSISGNRFEILITDELASNGVTVNNYSTALNRFSVLGVLNGDLMGFKAPLMVSMTPYNGNMYIQLKAKDVTTVEAMQNYLVNNDVKIVFNY